MNLRCLASFALLSACGQPSQPPSRTQEFSAPAITERTVVPGGLRRAQDIPHRLVREKIATGSYFFDSYVYDAEFPSLDRAQFETLRERYGSWSRSRSQVRYVPGTSWRLTDFLPPLLQATAGHLFLSHDMSLPLPHATSEGIRPAPTPVALFTNCWGTAYEILRQAGAPRSEFTLFYAPHALVKSFLRSPEWSDEVKPFSTAPDDFSTPERRNGGLKPGDVLLVGDGWLQHVAIYIDDDIFFEKAGAGPTALYRLTHFDVLRKTWDPTFYGWSFRRFGKKPLPEPRSQFNLAAMLRGMPESQAYTEEQLQRLSMEIMPGENPLASEEVSYFAEITMPLRFEEGSGRARLPEEAYSRDRVQSRLEDRE